MAEELEDTYEVTLTDYRRTTDAHGVVGLPDRVAQSGPDLGAWAL